MLDRLQRFYLWLVEWLAIAAIGLIVCAAALTLIDVVMRSVVKRPLFGTNDIVIMLLTVGILACFPYCTATRQHLRVTALGARLGARGFWIVEAMAGVAISVILGAFAWQFALRAMALAQTGEGTQLLAIPVAPVWWIGSAIMACAAIAQSLLIAHDVVAIVTGEPMPQADPGEVVA